MLGVVRDGWWAELRMGKTRIQGRSKELSKQSGELEPIWDSGSSDENEIQTTVETRTN
jgi:hypothetical protein